MDRRRRFLMNLKRSSHRYCLLLALIGGAAEFFFKRTGDGLTTTVSSWRRP
jgi:hypothetical protein